MKLCSFVGSDGGARLGASLLLDGEEQVLDLALAAPDLPRGMCKFLAAGTAARDATARVLGEASEGKLSSALLSLADVSWLPVVPRPRKFLAIGLNYAAHAEETGRQPPQFPTVFNKQVTCVNAHLGDISLPPESVALDFEGELAFVIGRKCRRVDRKDAPSVIAGYTIVNDVSVRDWQKRSPTMIMGKGWDTHGPMGPWLVTSDDIPNPHDLSLTTHVNYECRQNGHTSKLVFDCFRIVEILSTVFTLEPGDVVATGTPAGVGVAETPPRFLKDGDTVRIEIERIGTLINTVRAEAGA